MGLDKRLLAAAEKAAGQRAEALPEITDDMTAEEAASIYRRACQQRCIKTGADETFTGTPEEAAAAYRALLAEVYGTEPEPPISEPDTVDGNWIY